MAHRLLGTRIQKKSYIKCLTRKTYQMTVHTKCSQHASKLTQRSYFSTVVIISDFFKHFLDFVLLMANEVRVTGEMITIPGKRNKKGMHVAINTEVFKNLTSTHKLS